MQHRACFKQVYVGDHQKHQFQNEISTFLNFHDIWVENTWYYNATRSKHINCNMHKPGFCSSHAFIYFLFLSFSPIFLSYSDTTMTLSKSILYNINLRLPSLSPSLSLSLSLSLYYLFYHIHLPWSLATSQPPWHLGKARIYVAICSEHIKAHIILYDGSSDTLTTCNS